MELVNKVVSEAMNYKGHKDVLDRVWVFTNETLEDDVLEALSWSLIYIGDHPDINTRQRIVSLIFTKDEHVTLKFSDKELGTQGSYAFVRLDKLRKYSQIAQITIITEELVHHFWDTSDEVLTKQIVSSIVPGIKYDTDKNWYTSDQGEDL